MKSKNIVAILGAGPSGLVSARYALQEGLEPLILEKESQLGGVWNPDTGFVWKSLHTNLSKYNCSFADFPWPEDTTKFPSANEMFNYLNQYANYFGIISYINFNSKVINIKLEKENNNWLISWQCKDKIFEKKVSYVIISTGIFAEPFIPDIKGINSFIGNIIHSSKYKDNNDFQKQKVLIVGGSLTAIDIASDIATVNTEVIHSFRQPFWVLERYIPMELNSKEKLPLDLVFYNRLFYERELPKIEERYIGKNKYMEKLCTEQQQISELKIEKDNFNLPIKIAISDKYISQVKNNYIVPKKSNIVEFKNNRIVFSDGSVLEDCDAIIMATGFKTNLEYLDENIKQILQYDQDDQTQPIILYKETVHPEIPNMFFIGMYKGPYFAVIEHQAKWASKVFSGKLSLPPLEEIQMGLKEEYDIRMMIPKMQFPHPDYVKFADDIARLAGENLDLQI